MGNCCGAGCALLRANKYPLYVAVVMLFLFMCNQLSRLVLIATNVEMANELHFGDKVCNVSNNTAVELYIKDHHLNVTVDQFCTNTSMCEVTNDTDFCEWYYTGTGLEYQLLAGPLFVVLFSLLGIPLALVMEKTTINRKAVIIVCAILWSVMIGLAGFSQQYWHLAATRLALALVESPFTPLAASIVSSYCVQSLRGFGLGLFHWGVYVAFSMSYVLDIVVDHIGWRWAYWITAIPGFIFAIVMLITVNEPPREIASEHTDGAYPGSSAPFCSPLFIVLLITSSLRCAGGYVFTYNINNYFHQYYPDYPYQHFMTWIPCSMGIFGALLGGMLADRAVYYKGYVGRLYVFSLSIFVSIPLSVGVLYLDPPWCFIVLMPNYVAIEMWGSVAMSAMVEQAPRGRQTLALAFYVFSINMFGGNVNVIVPYLRSVIGLHYTLLALYPGMYALSLVFCLLTIPLAMLRMSSLGEIGTDDERKSLLNAETKRIN